MKIRNRISYGICCVSLVENGSAENEMLEAMTGTADQLYHILTGGDTTLTYSPEM